MIPLTLALLAALPAADPLPDGKTIDSFTFRFDDRGKLRKEKESLNGSLTITSDCKVVYQYTPHR